MQRILHKWPCHGDRAWFEFDSTTGGFIEYRVIRNHTGRVNYRRDCPGGTGWSDAAMSEVALIAMDYGMKKQAKYMKRIMNSPISILKLPKKLDSAFRGPGERNGYAAGSDYPAPYQTIAALCFENEWCLKRLRGVGVKTIAVVKQRLDKLGLTLDMPYEKCLAFVSPRKTDGWLNKNALRNIS
jgi:hypothetical protein